MPVLFETCVKQGGKVRTKRMTKGRYMRICFIKGKSYSGEVKKKNMAKTKKVKKSKSKNKK